MKRFKSYGFWTALAGALTMLASALAKYFGFTFDDAMINDIIMSVAGILVVLGVVVMPKSEDEEGDVDSKDEQVEECEDDADESARNSSKSEDEDEVSDGKDKENDLPTEKVDEKGKNNGEK